MPAFWHNMISTIMTNTTPYFHWLRDINTWNWGLYVMENKYIFSLSSAFFRQVMLHIMLFNYILKSYVNHYHLIKIKPLFVNSQSKVVWSHSSWCAYCAKTWCFLIFRIINTMRTTKGIIYSIIMRQQGNCLLDWCCASYIANNSYNFELALMWVTFELRPCTWYTKAVQHLANRFVSNFERGIILSRNLQFKFLGSPMKV